MVVSCYVAAGPTFRQHYTHDMDSKASYDERYANQTDAWTKDNPDEILMQFLPQLTGGKENPLDFFIPLCGKCIELVTLADQGHHVTGVDFCETAIKMFFEENSLKYSTESCTFGGTSSAVKYTATEKAITVYCCDFFGFPNVNQYDCVWDTAAIHCFDPATRPEYVKAITEVTKVGGTILLTAFDYEHSERPSPPYAVTQEEVNLLYGAKFDVQLVCEYNLEQTLKQMPIREKSTRFYPWKLSRFAKKYYFLKKL